MSNSASIAAAKRRRGGSQNPQVASGSSSRNINRIQSEPILEKCDDINSYSIKDIEVEKYTCNNVIKMEMRK